MVLNQVIFPNYTIGSDALKRIGSEVKKIGNYILVVGGKTALEKVENDLEKVFHDHEISCLDFMWYGGECNSNNIQKIVDVVKKNGIDMIIGVGGGKALDTAKAAAHFTEVPIITVPTIAATCAATTPLSIIYNENGDFDSLLDLNSPPVHIVMDTAVIADAPTRYLWAGIGDTLAKYYEVELASRDKILSHSASMAKSLSILCKNPLIQYGRKALEDSDNKIPSYEVEQIILNNIITTGLVSMLIGQENNGSIAHGMFYGFTLLEEIEKRHLHGEVVAYGILILLSIDGNLNDLSQLIEFYKTIDLPTSLVDLEVKNDRDYLKNVLEKAANAPDMLKTPYRVTEDMIFDAMQRLEVLKTS